MVGLACAVSVGRDAAAAEGGLQLNRPSERPLPSVPPLPEGPPPEIQLPPPPPPAAPPGQLSAGPRVVLKEIRITGSTVFTPEELAEVAKPYLDHQVSTEDLLSLRDALTLLYVNKGYVNSGAVIPDQHIENGVMEVQIVEGRLGNVEIEGNEYFRTRYLRERLERAGSTPLDVAKIEERLRLLQADPRIARVEAELVPGPELGTADLRVRVHDLRPYHVSLEGSNHEAPSIGEYRGDLGLFDENLTGNGDTLSFDFGYTQGLYDYDANYQLPFTPWDTRLVAHFRESNSTVVQRPFNQIDITSTITTYGVGFSQPLYQTVNTSVDASLTWELRSSKTYLLGQPFSFSLGSQDGRSRVDPIRFGLEWLYRDERQVWAARSTASFGLDAVGATPNHGNEPGGQYVAELMQLQYVRRFQFLATELVLRTDAQVASRALLPMEQFVIGGFSTVRGYQENQLVADQGYASSIEVRVPVFHTRDSRFLVQIAPFFDIGQAWNISFPSPSPNLLASVGVGLRASFLPWVTAEIYYGYRIVHVPIPSDRSLQDDGITFSVTTYPF
ncbi:MAG TPA: ShlB/FhaC/HecB family hemolysin secretion/activation protein [Myxococcota bacterium]|nr:ShlB/FhaC/HecB family hemolysin secretion/activation protein [Myxococcota bacterium]